MADLKKTETRDAETSPAPSSSKRSKTRSMTAAQLPKIAPLLVAAVAIALGVLLGTVLGWGLVGMLVVAWLVFVIGLTGWSMAVEGKRKAVDRFAASIIWSAFVLALIPLLSLIYTVLKEGTPILSYGFLSADFHDPLAENGGIYHAIMGTAIITALAALISIPIGVLAAIYLVEYGKKNTISRVITFLVDVMTGIPSIVAGLFGFGLFVVITGDPLPRLGMAGAVALSLLMIPTVIRSTEEMLKLVPDELREASYALGVPKWRTIMKVVLPTAVAGIITGVTLAIARVAGETAPLLVTAGTTGSLNFNPFDGNMMTIPVFIFSSQNAMSGQDGAMWTERLWGAALVLIIIVMVLNILARIIGKVFAPKTGR